MQVQNSIQEKLESTFKPSFLAVENESHRHNVPKGSESHFKVTITSDTFAGKSLVQRHQAVNAALQYELEHLIHALALHTYTPDEWQARQSNSPDSPTCRGGMKRESSE